jgi:hypothetical protein
MNSIESVDMEGILSSVQEPYSSLYKHKFCSGDRYGIRSDLLSGSRATLKLCTSKGFLMCRHDFNHF